LNQALKLLAAAGLLAASTLCMAQASAPAAPASPAKKALIEKLLAIQQSGVEMLAREMVQRPLGPLMQQASAALQQVPADKREATAKALDAEVKKFLDESVPQVKASASKAVPGTVGALLDERFTEDELRQVLAWMESPVSKKFGSAQPDMQKALIEKIMADTGPALEARFKTLQQDMSKTFAATQGQPAASAAKPAPAASKPAPAKK
jgi:hypothetical protein